MIRSLVSVTALYVCCTAADAAALTMQQCRDKYKASIVEKTLSHSWEEYQVKQCGLPPTRKQSKSSR